MSAVLRTICKVQVVMSFFIGPLIFFNLELLKRLAADDCDFRHKYDK